MFGTIDKLYGGICTMKWDKYTIETTTEAEDYRSEERRVGKECRL